MLEVAMMFKNQRGEEVHLADSLTLQELVEMGMSIQLTEQSDKEHQIWQDEGLESDVSTAE
jgi:hypothetical protein